MKNFDVKNLPFTLLSNSEQDTLALAAQMAQNLPEGTVIAMYGDLGAGKTVFARGFARALGIVEPVTSPTYTILQEYLRPNGHYFYHLDLYRINNSRDALAFAVDEYLNDPQAYILLEWPERIADILPPGTIRLTIKHIDDTHREITVG